MLPELRGPAVVGSSMARPALPNADESSGAANPWQLAHVLEVLAAVSLLLSLGYLGYFYILAGSQYLRVFFR